MSCRNSDIECLVPDNDRAKKPVHWKRQLANVKEMRKNRDAPVDTMGCERLAKDCGDPKTFRLQVLISLMLSSQTKDQITAAAMKQLISYGCNLQELLRIDIEVLRKMIYPVGFYKRKADYIKKTCVILNEKFNGDIPDTIEGLCSLPGVGSKMAHLAMQCAWNKVSGIGVDTHVHRIANRLGWVKNTKTPEDTRIGLESWLPRTHWREINWLLVGFGQQICLPNKPKCTNCLNRSICPHKSKQ